MDDRYPEILPEEFLMELSCNTKEIAKQFDDLIFFGLGFHGYMNLRKTNPLLCFVTVSMLHSSKYERFIVLFFTAGLLRWV